MSLALSICILFITLMKLANGAQFLNTTSIPLLFAGASVSAMFGTVLVP